MAFKASLSSAQHRGGHPSAATTAAAAAFTGAAAAVAEEGQGREEEPPAALAQYVLDGRWSGRAYYPSGNLHSARSFVVEPVGGPFRFERPPHWTITLDHQHNHLRSRSNASTLVHPQWWWWSNLLEPQLLPCYRF